MKDSETYRPGSQLWFFLSHFRKVFPPVVFAGVHLGNEMQLGVKSLF